jgi:hypothetical protein
MVNTPQRIVLAGRAYAVFKCSDERPFPVLSGRFREALENILRAHEETKIPTDTKFQVFDVNAGLEFAITMDHAVGLAPHVDVIAKKGANYMIRSELPGASNETAATDLGDVMNMLYGATELFDAENPDACAAAEQQDGVPRVPNPLIMDIFYQESPGVFVSKLTMDMIPEVHIN